MNKEQPDKFRDHTGKLLIKALFLEHLYDTKYAVYTVKDQDYEYKGVVYPSLKKLYLYYADPTEYVFATNCFYNWNQWKRIARSDLMKDRVEEWREELEAKLKAEAIQEMRKKAQDPKGTTAAKWLAERGWAPRRNPGAPSKEEREHQKNIDKKVERELEEELNRMENLEWPES